MHPALTESLVLAQVGLSGVGLGLLLGMRHPVVLAFFGLGGATAIRVLSAFAAWSLGSPGFASEAWLWGSLSAALLGMGIRWRWWRETMLALSLLAAGSLLSLSAKYVFDIGEKEHTDSAEQVALALVAIQGEMSDLGIIAGSPKRGIAYALMLGLGPEGRILSGLTPLIFLSMIGAVLWLAWKLSSRHTTPRIFILTGVIVAGFSLSVPIFRASMFYLNAHTLMAYGLILMVAGVFAARLKCELTSEALALILVGGIIGVTARIEGFVLVAICLLALASETWWNGVSRWRLGVTTAVLGITLSWWLSAVGSNVPAKFGIPLWLMPLLSVAGAVLIASPAIDRIRGYLIPGLAVVFAGILIREVALSRDPIAAALAQWPNLGLGEGGWATAAWVWIAGLILLGWKAQSGDYRRLVVLSGLFIGAILFTKTFDGGFGREGFFDSVNRMFLHVMPVIVAASVVGLSSALSRVVSGHRGKMGRTGSATSASTIGGRSQPEEGV